MLTAEQRQFYLDNGYLIIENILSAERLQRIRDELEQLYITEGEQAGSEGVDNPGVRRLCNLMAKGRALEELAREPIALEVARLTIGDEIRWQAMNFHDPIPNDSVAHQSIHADRSFFPNCKGYITIAWAIDDMTEENGATRILPGSHKGPWPNELLENARETVDGEIYAVCPAGSAVFIHGDVWHGGRANYSNTSRRVIHLGFGCPNTAPQYEITDTLTAEARQRMGELCALLPGNLASYGLESSQFIRRNVDKVMENAPKAKW